jgi:hypothetical protein
MVQNKRQINNKQLTSTELTTFQKENLKTKKAILEYKTACEANVCAILYKEPSKYLETKLQLNEFNDNVWRVYFALFDGVVIREKKGTIDSIIAGIFLEHHPKLRAKYEEYGGWQTIEDAGAYVKVEAFDGYVAELRKWGAMLKLAEHGWIDQSRMSEYSDMSAEDIYNELQVYINDTFINIDNDIKSYDIGDGIDALIDELDEGFAVGLPYYNMPILTKETGGQYLGSITLVGGLSNVGKEQPISEPVLTEHGWIPMGDVKIGTKVFGCDGKLHNVIGIYPQGIKDIYQVTFNDGTHTRCGLEHLWKVYTQTQRKKNKHLGGDRFKILPLSEIIKDYKHEYINNDKNGRRNITAHKYSIPLCKPIEFNNKENLLIDPYALGLLLGDGGFTTATLTFTNSELELFEQLNECLRPFDVNLNIRDYKHHRQAIIRRNTDCDGKKPKRNKLRVALENLGLLGCDSRNKFVPDIYKYSSIDNRAKILSGLLNTDGSITRPCCTSFDFCSSSEHLAKDVADIARSLGYKVSIKINVRDEKESKKYGILKEYIVRIMSDDWSLLTLSSKHKALLKTSYNSQPKLITDIKYVGKEECQCIYVDSDEHLYITNDYIVTHNTSFARTAVIPSVIKNNEKIVVMLNEDGIKKWQRELLVFVANNIFKRDVQKHVVRDGKFSSETREALVEAANWIKENTRNHTITIIPFQRYKTSNVIKIIKKYSGMGVKYFLLDTFKLDAGRVSDNSWIEMQQNMVEINDVVKPEANNLHILITFQLAKGSAMQRYYTQDNVGMAKNIVDPASTVLMLRNVYDDEYEGEKRELQCYRIEGTKSKVPVHLTKDKKYQVLFIIKNREGSANQYQIVLEHDMSRNILKEVGMCNVSIDW